MVKSKPIAETKNSRRVKRLPESKKTHPIKEEWQRRKFVDYFAKRRDRAKTPCKWAIYDRDYMIVLTALYTGLRAEDLLQVYVKQLSGGRLDIIENKTTKRQYFELPSVYYSELLDYIKRHDLKPTDTLFRRGNTGGPSATPAVTRQRLDRVIKEAGEAVGIPFKIGMHGLRKTFGYMCRTQWGYSLADIRIFLNLEDEATTEIYIEWDTEDTDKMRAKMDLQKSYRPKAGRR